MAERLESDRPVRDVLGEMVHPRKPPVRWVPELLWRPFAALAAHGALPVAVGVLLPALRARPGSRRTGR
ncbi:hypothetical protein GCM10010211_14450 [Streptomyces albospinus]|uniref:Uncharacterized protein n=1 Tax=Streptomyces albospinus TaxID=285515 RepID=A0ABQ2US50_9ACTN|nr:hypothetical protein [Streptomyces albospinus]GGU50964.1 hypothetical protein GCM10010211_14450 [Streptomyces albospinus]